jgi:two-component system, cell cycle response regulator
VPLLFKVEDPHCGLFLRVPEGVNEIGRDAALPIQICHASVSRRHARLLFLEGRLWVEDLHSTNGTYVNEQRVHGSLPVFEGDTVRLGDVVLRLVMEENPPEDRISALLNPKGIDWEDVRRVTMPIDEIDRGS